MKIEVFRGKDDLFYYRRLADNGEPIDTSEGHDDRDETAEVAAKYSPPGTRIVFVEEDS